MTAGVDPQWRLDLVAPAQVYPSDADIMRRTMELTLAALQRSQGGPFGALIARGVGEVSRVGSSARGSCLAVFDDGIGKSGGAHALVDGHSLRPTP